MTQLAVKIPFSGFYETSHNAIFDSWLDYEQDLLLTEHEATKEQIETLAEKFYDCVNWKKAHIEYAKAYCGELERLIKDESRQYKEDSTGKRYLSEGLDVSIVFDALESPKEYNYSTDCIYALIELDSIKAMFDALDKDEWREFVAQKCTSYSGFISFYPNDFDKWEEDISQWGEARLGMVLELYLCTILEGKDLEEALSAYSLMERLEGNGFISELIFTCANQDFRDYADSLRKDI